MINGIVQNGGDYELSLNNKKNGNYAFCEKTDENGIRNRANYLNYVSEVAFK